MPPQNTIHSARTLRDLLNLFLFVRHDLLNLFLFIPSRPSQSFQAIHHEALHVLSLLFRTTHQYVRTPSAWIDAPGSGVVLGHRHDLLVPIFSAIHHDPLVPIFSAIRHDPLVQIFSAIRPGLLVQIFSAHPSRSSCANFLGNPSRRSCCNFLGNPSTMLLCQEFGLTALDCRRLLVNSGTHQELLVSSAWIDAPDCRRLNLLHPSDCSCKRSG